MLLGYVYKLRPNNQQSIRMESWLNLLRSSYNWSLTDRINTYEQRLIQGEYCDLRTKAVAYPLTCCVSWIQRLEKKWFWRSLYSSNEIMSICRIYHTNKRILTAPVSRVWLARQTTERTRSEVEDMLRKRYRREQSRRVAHSTQQ